MTNSIYTRITETAVIGAMNRVLDDLNELTNGNADKAIRYVAEFAEFAAIVNEIKERKAKETTESTC